MTDGDSRYIKRINVNELNSWHTLSTQFYDIPNASWNFDSGGVRHMAPISYQHYILLLTGWDGSNEAEEDIFLFNIETMNIKFFAKFPLSIRSPEAVLANNSIFTFGGITDNSPWDVIYHSNRETQHPTMIPTINPSNQPTNEPTLQPTIDPSGQPTNQPTSQPTSEPSGQKCCDCF